MKFLKNLATTGLIAATTIAGATVVAAPAQAAFFGGNNCSGTERTLAYVKNRGCSLQVGDKIFSDFTPLLTNSRAGSPTPEFLSEIKITEFGGGGSPGFIIASLFSAESGAWTDLDLTYKVTVTDPAQFLSGVVLALGGASTTGTGIAQVTETVFRDNAGAIGDVLGKITANDLSPRAELSFDSVKSAWVNKDIFVKGGAKGTATLSSINNTHTQVPTPALLPGLLGLGLTAMRKRNKQAQAVTA